MGMAIMDIAIIGITEMATMEMAIMGAKIGMGPAKKEITIIGMIINEIAMMRMTITGMTVMESIIGIAIIDMGITETAKKGHRNNRNGNHGNDNNGGNNGYMYENNGNGNNWNNRNGNNG